MGKLLQAYKEILQFLKQASSRLARLSG